MTALVVQRCGPMTSLQDAGRVGFQRFGVSNSGAMDHWGLAAANALVGNPAGAGAVEFMLMGGALTVEGGTARLAVAGAPCAVAVDGVAAGSNVSLTLRPGETLTLGAAERGIFVYLAAAGGLATPPVLGSLSLQPRAGIGGLEGRPLRPGDRLALVLDNVPPGPERALDPAPLEAGAPVRVVLGPQDDFFTPEGIATLLSSPYTVSREADRMGYRLTGPAVAHARGFNIVSDGIAAGSIQVPGAGQPIVTMADRQTAGGYPKIATVISTDLRVLAQRRAGETVRFETVGIEAAQAIARERAALLAALGTQTRPLRGGLPGSEELLGLNLAGAAVDALTAG